MIIICSSEWILNFKKEFNNDCDVKYSYWKLYSKLYRTDIQENVSHEKYEKYEEKHKGNINK